MNPLHSVAVLVLFSCLEVLPAQTSPGVSSRPAGVMLDGQTTRASEETRVDFSRPAATGATLSADNMEEAFLQAAMRGEAWAQTQLGKIYTDVPDDDPRLLQGIQWLRSAAQQNDAEAVYLLATLTASGRGVEKSLVTAFEQMQRAAELGFAEAQYDLATMFANAQGTPQSEEKALHWARRAAAQGQLNAMHAAAVTGLRRAKTDLEISEGLQMLEKAADRDHRAAQMVLAGILTRGEFGLDKDILRAEALLQPRARNGDPEFQFGLATLYLYGSPANPRTEEGLEWLNKSAASGWLQAQELLSKINAEASAASE